MFIVLCITAHMSQLRLSTDTLHLSGPSLAIALHRLQRFPREALLPF